MPRRTIDACESDNRLGAGSSVSIGRSSLSRESFLVALDASCRAYHADLSSGDFMSEKTGIERRTLLRAITAASGTALSSALPPRHVAAQPASRAAAADSDHFETAEIKTGDNTIFIRRYGKGSPLLMVHGFPRTSLMWRYMAPRLANSHTVICVDLRGYGRRASLRGGSLPLFEASDGERTRCGNG